MHSAESASEWVCRWTHLIPPNGTVLDVACGAGRHLRWLHTHGHTVIGVDRNAQLLSANAYLGEMVCADLENGPWPFTGRVFDTVLVTNYLWRPLMATIVSSVAPSGLLIYETFTVGNETVGRPARPEFLLEPAELLRACAELRVVAFEEGFLEGPDRFVQRIVAAREPDVALAPHRYPLSRRAS